MPSDSPPQGPRARPLLAAWAPQRHSSDAPPGHALRLGHPARGLGASDRPDRSDTRPETSPPPDHNATGAPLRSLPGPSATCGDQRLASLVLGLWGSKTLPLVLSWAFRRPVRTR